MTHARVVGVDEFIDPGRGGVTLGNLAAGRDAAHGEALAELGITEAAVLSVSEPEPVFAGGATVWEACSRWGSAWGSFLYRTADDAVMEVVYLYVGICNDGDAEGFYFSETPVEVCVPGSLG